MSKHHGSCQCGAVTYEVEDLDVEHAIVCNCSRCRRLGSVLSFVPRARFTLLQGEGDLQEYLFNKEVIRHQFCRTCGIECFAFGRMPDGTPMTAINLNTVDGVDPRRVETTSHDGASV